MCEGAVRFDIPCENNVRKKDANLFRLVCILLHDSKLFYCFVLPHPISNSYLCFYILRFCGISFNFPSSGSHKGAKYLCIFPVTLSPYLPQDCMIGKYFSRILHKKKEKLIFQRCQMNLLVILIGNMRSIVQLQTSIDIYRVIRFLFRTHVVHTIIIAQRHTDPRHQFCR